VSVKGKSEGVMRLAFSLGIISTPPFCHVPSAEYVVPRSIPITGSSESARLVRKTTRLPSC